MSSIDANGLNLLRGFLTVVLMFGFITLVVWLYSRKHRDIYEAAAKLPLEDMPPERSPLKRDRWSINTKMDQKTGES